MTESDTPAKPLSYADSGVHIDAGNRLVDLIKPAVARTRREGVLQGLGGFGGLFEIPAGRFRQPVLVSGTDGVGTKLKLAMMLDRHDTIGIDLVAMCVNDIVVCGAEPLYFLDYYATGALDVERARIVIEGIARGCELAGCALIGGETAEMPGMYAAQDYDLAGFAVGIVEKENIIVPEHAQQGDVIIGLASSGFHSNGYSLVRKVLDMHNEDTSRAFGDTTLGEALLAPTRIYVKSILGLIERCTVTALCHITGGGITENLPRVLPDTLSAGISRSGWNRPAIFDWVQAAGNIEADEMLRTFNCGIGMIVCVHQQDTDIAMRSLADAGETPFIIGQLLARDDQAVVYRP